MKYNLHELTHVDVISYTS